MTVLLKNNVQGFLATAISNLDNVLTLSLGNGSVFPSPGAGEYFYATISTLAGSNEIVKCTARAGDVLTVVRGQEGTTAIAFASGSRVELRVTAQAVIDAIADRVSQKDQASEISFVPYANISSTNVQAAIQEEVDDLAAGSGSSLIGFVSAGGGASARTVQARLRQTVSVKDFGAVGDGVTDDTAALQAAANYAATLTAPILVVDAGDYYISGAVYFQLPNYSTINFIGRILANVTNDSAVVIGSIDSTSAGNRFGYTVTGLKVRRTTVDSTGSSIGIRLQSLVASYIDVRECQNFRDGVFCYGVSPNGGFSYNELHLGLIHDNRTNLRLTATGSGYCNENNFFGGSYNHSSGYPAVTTANLVIDHFAASELNSNRFFGPSFEDNSTLAVAARINGFNNVIYNPRMERSVSQATYQIIFEADSTECSVFGYGFVVAAGNISDLGGGNSYQTRDGWFYQSQAGTGAAEGVFRARSTNTGNAKIFRADDPTGTLSAYMDGNGVVVGANRVYGEQGLRWATSSGTLNDRGLYANNASPESAVTAEPGSLFAKTNGGAGQTLWVKESGSSNTGWKAALTQPEEVTAVNIAAVANAINTTGKFTGKLVWDSTNNRMMRASGALAASAWYVIDGSTSVTPS